MKLTYGPKDIVVDISWGASWALCTLRYIFSGSGGRGDVAAFQI